MELRHLRYFVAVAESQHFGRAAKVLHTAQPSLSYQIRQLEKEIGTPLFVRTTRRVRLTVAGDAFLTEARSLLLQLDKAVQYVRDVGAGILGRLRIAYISGSMGNVLPLILRDFSTAFPDVAVDLTSMWTDAQIEALREQRLDIGIFGSGLRPEGLSHADAWRSHYVVALPHGHELCRRETLAYTDLEGQSLIVSRASGSRMSDNIFAVLQRHNVNASFIYQDAALETIIGLVAARRGLALVPSSWSEMPHAALEFRQIEPITPLPGLGFYWNSKAAAPLVRTFLESAKATIAKLPPGAPDPTSTPMPDRRPPASPSSRSQRPRDI